MARQDDRLDELEVELRHTAPELFRDPEVDSRDQVPEQGGDRYGEPAGERSVSSVAPSRPVRRPAARVDQQRRIAWGLLVFALLGLGFGVAVGQGLMIAAGLVLAGLAGQLLDRCHARAHGEPPYR